MGVFFCFGAGRSPAIGQQKGSQVRLRSIPQLHSYREPLDACLRVEAGSYPLHEEATLKAPAMGQGAPFDPVGVGTNDLPNPVQKPSTDQLHNTRWGSREVQGAAPIQERDPRGTGRFDSFFHHRVPASRYSAREQRQSSAETQSGPSTRYGAFPARAAISSIPPARSGGTLAGRALCRCAEGLVGS